MSTISRLFGSSPFFPLRHHMEQVARCVRLLPELLTALEKGDEKKMKKVADTIGKLEHEADITKNDLRNHLFRGSFLLSIDRSMLLEILSLQDLLADKAEDVAITTTLAPLSGLEAFETEFHSFWEKNLLAFEQVFAIIAELGGLSESAFGGLEAEKVREMVEAIGVLEHEIDVDQTKLLRHLYKAGKEMNHATFHLWLTLLHEIGAISNVSEKLANRIRMILELS